MGIFILFLIIQTVSAYIYHDNQEYMPLSSINNDEKFNRLNVGDSAVSVQQIQQTLSITDSIVNVIESSLASFEDPIVFDDIHESSTSEKISYKVKIKGITISGLSGIVINDVSVRLLPTRVVFDLTIPRLVFNIDSCIIVVRVQNIPIDINISGQIIVTNSKLGGTIGIRLLPPDVSSFNAVLKVGSIKSKMIGSVADVDIEPLLTSSFEHYLPLILFNISGEINAALSAFIFDLIRSQI